MISTAEISMEEYKVLLRNDFVTFIERAFYELNPHAFFITGQYIGLMAATLEKCRMGQTKRLIINLPPRTLKSHAASVAFPAWLLGHDPAKQIICASYGQDLADKHARDCRTLISSAFFRDIFPRTRLGKDVGKRLHDHGSGIPHVDVGWRRPHRARRRRDDSG